jgi:hypothetical protein
MIKTVIEHVLSRLHDIGITDIFGWVRSRRLRGS